MGTEIMAVRAIVSGVVQGVYYRQSCAQEANRLGLAGWVTNLEDGRVELYAEGPQSAVEKLVMWSMKGPVQARVEDVAAKWVKVEGHVGPFVVRR